MPSNSVEPRRILAFFAHPDDELSVGGTLARCAGEGVEVTLICATRGEAATIFSPPEYGATPENLADVRTGELECCCQQLGIEDLRWLDWPDGGVADVERTYAVNQIVAAIRDVQPQVMITHPDHGGYPHPDHIAIHEIALAAWEAAADPAYRPALGAAHAIAKLYCRVIPLSFFEASPEFAEYRVQLNGEQLPFFGTPDDEITLVIDTAAWAEQRMAGWECHKSQHNPAGMLSQMSEDVRKIWVSREYLHLVAHRLPAVAERETDLFAGLEQQAAAAAEPAADVAEAAPAVDVAELASRLLSAVRTRRAYLEIYKDYRKRQPKPEFAELLDALIEDAQEGIAELSSQLRRLDRSPMQASTNEKLVAQGTMRKGAPSKLNFLLVGSTKALEWYQSQMAGHDPAEVRAVWQFLADMERRHQAMIKRVLGIVEQASVDKEDEQ